MEQIIRSRGVNRSEQILASLCERAFLPLWCYPNLYRQRAKELADVLVVFGDDVIIFSDKAHRFPDSGDISIDWGRWKRESIDDSVRQLRRAENWLRKHPQEVYLDAKCSQRFPLTINPNGHIHKVVVARNAKARCASMHGRSGSLAIHGPSVLATSESRPFEIHLSEFDEFVHVFDEVSLPLVLSELDTAADFLDYLKKKEVSFRTGQIASSYAEEETLAVFLTSVLQWSRDPKERVFPIPNSGESIAVGPGFWNELVSLPEYNGKKRADEVSYLWDTILREFGEGVHRGEAPNPFGLSLERLEYLGRRLASETRLQRRELAMALVTAKPKVKPRQVLNRTVLSRRQPGIAYVFSLHPCLGASYEEHRTFRQRYGLLYAAHTLRREQGLSEVIVISTDFAHEEESSFDFALVQRGEAQLEAWADEFAHERGWATKLNDLSWVGIRSREFPVAELHPQKQGPHQQKNATKNQRKSQRRARRRNRTSCR
jgi:hypothetical protein